MTVKQMYPLIDRMLELGMSEDLIEAVCEDLETESQQKTMLQWLNKAINPTREEVIAKILLISDPT